MESILLDIKDFIYGRNQLDNKLKDSSNIEFFK